MTTDLRPPPHPSGGFTLIEVLVALVILAVGLLALEALGIGAARMVNRARLQSTWAATATDTLERTLARVRQRQSVASQTFAVQTDPGFADTVRLKVDSTALLGTSTLRRFDVTVTVVPRARKLISRADSLRVVGSVVR